MNIVSRYLKAPDKALRKINNRLFFIAAANVIDGLLTYIGVSNHYITELNKLMTAVVENIYLLMVVKIAIPTTLLFLIAYSLNKYGYKKMKAAVLSVNVCFAAYVLIILIHFIWIVQLI